MTKDKKRLIIKRNRTRTLPRWSILHSERLKSERTKRNLFSGEVSLGEMLADSVGSEPAPKAEQ